MFIQLPTFALQHVSACFSPAAALIAASSSPNDVPPVWQTLLKLSIPIAFVIWGTWYSLRLRHPKAETPPVTSAIRETLFGDMPLKAWATNEGSGPGACFAEAQHLLRERKREEAAAALKKVLAIPGLESRHYLQAWHFLKPLQHVPGPEEFANVLGVVVEHYLPDGLDLVAAYADHSARYYNYSGAGVVWEHPDASLDADIDLLLAAAADTVKQIGPWRAARPGPPQKGQMRLNILTPGGLCFGQGPMDVLAEDPKVASMVRAATNLMLKLIGKTQR